MSVASVGLTEAEARARLAAGQQNTTRLKPTRPRDLVRRESILTIFHLNIIGLAFIQLLMREWISALLTLLLSVITTGIRAGQEALARRRLEAHAAGFSETIGTRVSTESPAASAGTAQWKHPQLIVTSPGTESPPSSATARGTSA